jgi:hypothetical protein
MIPANTLLLEMGSWNHDLLSWNLTWKRHLGTQEQDHLNLLITMLNRVSLKQHQEDSKLWEIEKTDKYIVKSCNTLIDRIAYPAVSSFSHLLLERYSPSKNRSFHMVMALHGRLCTRDFLVRRNLIDIDSRMSFL